MSKIVAEITPQNVARHRYRATCRATGCSFVLTATAVPDLNGWAEAHVRASGHAVVIEDTAPPVDMCHGTADERAVCGGSDARCRRDPACNE